MVSTELKANAHCSGREFDSHYFHKLKYAQHLGQCTGADARDNEGRSFMDSRATISIYARLAQ